MDDALGLPPDNAERSTARTDPTEPQPSSDPETPLVASVCVAVISQSMKNDPASCGPPHRQGITTSMTLQGRLVQRFLKYSVTVNHRANYRAGIAEFGG